MNLQNKLIKFMKEYRSVFERVWKTGIFKDDFGNFVRHDIADEIGAIAHSYNQIYFSKGSVGQTKWTPVPWIAIFDNRITQKATEGEYIVYLLNSETKELYLTFNQAAEGKNSVAVRRKLKEKAETIRKKLSFPNKFKLDDIDTGNGAYDAGCICYIKYTLDTLPSDEDLKNDLLAFLNIYLQYHDKVYLKKKTEYIVGKFDSWEIIDDVTAIKTCDKSFFAYNGSGVPKEICWFFDAEDIPQGENKSVKLIFKGKEYLGKLTNDTTDRRRIQIRWNGDLAKGLEEYQTNTAKAKFVKLANGIYEITIEEGENDMAVTVLDNIIQAMKNIGGKGSYFEIYTAYEELTGQILTDGKKAGIRKIIEDYSSDSDNYKGKEDVFYSVAGKGKGVWGLRGYNGKAEMTIKDKIQNIKSYIEAKGFNYEGNLIENFYLSLKSKSFVILAGTSGTGKTKLVKLFADAIGAKIKLVPVRPDWSDSSDLFGHVDLASNFKPGAIIDFVKQAELDKSRPYFLCLDEMNLARVEYYLSDFLSIIETRERVNGEIITEPLVSEEYYQNDTDAKDKYGKLIIPENLYIIGTVNMDETTFPFSKKVLDRANTIEFSFVNFMPKEQPVLSANALSLDNSFLKTKYLYFNDIGDKEFKNDISFKLEELNEILKKANLHVGYRVRDEISFYMMNNKECELLEENIAFDNEIMQKILPRIQGSSGAIKQLLCDLFMLCAGDYSGFSGSSIHEQMSSYVEMRDCKYTNTAKKIVFMMRRYEEDGFTSYWL